MQSANDKTTNGFVMGIYFVLMAPVSIILA